MYSEHCTLIFTMYSPHFLLYTVLWTLYIYTVQYTLFTVQCTLNTVHLHFYSTVNTVYCTLCYAHCTFIFAMHSTLCSLYSENCTFTVQWFREHRVPTECRQKEENNWNLMNLLQADMWLADMNWFVARKKWAVQFHTLHCITEFPTLHCITVVYEMLKTKS